MYPILLQMNVSALQWRDEVPQNLLSYPFPFYMLPVFMAVQKASLILPQGTLPIVIAL
jgi:hypothetical protein